MAGRPREEARGRLVEVALPVPLFQTFTYSVPESLDSLVMPGARVLVPWRNGREIGICVGPSSTIAPDVRVKAILEAPDDEPALGADLLKLSAWISEYYIAPPGQVLRSTIPALLSGTKKPRPHGRTRRVLVLARELPSLMDRDRVFARAARQRELFELVESLGGRSPVEHLMQRLSFAPTVLRALVERGLATVEREEVDRDPFARRLPPPPSAHAPSPAQRRAIDSLVAARGGETFLLRGVTGSGKTLVYIELLRRVVEERGRTAIVLVPEIALTPQTVDRFRSVFGDLVAVLHSGLSDGERFDAWRALRSGTKRIAVGARSAIFAPLPDLGAIVVDEEHEGSYKQNETPRYHAREVAVMRGRLTGAVVVLGSATPSLESWTNAEKGKYRLLELPERAGAGRLPEVHVVDLRGAIRTRSASPPDPFRRIVSEPLEQALRDCLERGEQGILLLNRRGYSAFVQCGMCGEVTSCPHCSITLTYHRAPERMMCHYCMHEEPARDTCQRCGGLTLRERGLGTQQVERALSERFPAARIARMDVDTTSGKWAHTEILDRVGRGEVDFLLGTQMIAKGLDFPNVTLVGVVDADVGVNLPDFRASERCFQLLSQVAGRAGRGSRSGEVYIQTRLPGHHAVRAAVAHDYLSFVRSELEGRKAPAYPPVVRLANIVVSSTVEREVVDAASGVAGWFDRLRSRERIRGLDVIGPAPCAVERIKTRWRWHVMLRGSSAGTMTRVLRYFAVQYPSPDSRALRIQVDRDPVSVL
jgi:primosomal protein N' (replication factor Y) (superfamily II helicase)